MIPAFFWSIAADTTSPDSAKKGFSFIVAIGQFGGIVGPFFIASLPRRLGLQTSDFIFICAIAIGLSMVFLYRFFKTPDHCSIIPWVHEKKEEAQQEPGFFEGLKLIISYKYLMGIFAVVALPEIITAIFDQHFDILLRSIYGNAFTEYLGIYASAVNIMAFTFFLCGIGNITRIFGLGISLVLMPVLYALATLGFMTLNSLTFLFGLMASSKAINYALNGPAIKQLYIPTTHDVRLKAQAWIESFGSRGSKLPADVNLGIKPLQIHLAQLQGARNMPSMRAI